MKGISPEQRVQPRSFIKLPKLQEIDYKKQQQSAKKKQSSPSPKRQPIERQASHALSLYSKRGSSLQIGGGTKIEKVFTQENESTNSRMRNNNSLLKLKPIQKNQSPHKNILQLKMNQQPKHKINLIDSLRDNNKVESAGSSRTTINPAGDLVSNLLKEDTLKMLAICKVYKQAAVGEMNASWWNVIDSVFATLLKVIKIREDSKSPDKNDNQKTKSNIKQSANKKLLVKQQKQTKQKFGKQKDRKITGIVQSNTKVSIQLSKVYSCLENQLRNNEQSLLRFYEDPVHLCLILQVLFYQKSIIYLIGSLRKWKHQEQQLYIHGLAIQMLPCIIECRKLIVQILMQAVENQQQDNKIRKPKYIAREKKLIQISKFVNVMKVNHQKYIAALGSPNKYKTFQLPQMLKEHSTIISLQQKWRNIIFDVPLAPYVQILSPKKYLLVIEPLNILYRYNKKQESLQIDSYAEIFLNSLNSEFDIVFFTAVDKESSLLNFLGILNRAQILGVLDRNYLSFFNAKPIKNISKITDSFNQKKILILDDKSNSKYYANCYHPLMLIESRNYDKKLVRVNGKLIRSQQSNDDYLKDLGARILNCAKMGGKWEEIISEKTQRSR